MYLGKGHMARNRTKFGEQLRLCRKQRDLTLQELSLLLGGIWSVAAISRYEHGLRRPPAGFLVKVVEMLRLDEEEEYSLVRAWLADALIILLDEYAEATIVPTPLRSLTVTKISPSVLDSWLLRVYGMIRRIREAAQRGS